MSRHHCFQPKTRNSRACSQSRPNEKSVIFLCIHLAHQFLYKFHNLHVSYLGINRRILRVGFPIQHVSNIFYFLQFIRRWYLACNCTTGPETLTLPIGNHFFYLQMSPGLGLPSLSVLFWAIKMFVLSLFYIDKNVLIFFLFIFNPKNTKITHVRIQYS